MRLSTRASAPLFVITAYYAFFLVGFAIFSGFYPEFDDYLPVGGISELLERGGSSFEPVEIIRTAIVQAPHMARLALAMIGSLIMMLPISWIYFITTPNKGVDRAFAQTMMVLPIIVAGIAMIVQNSIPLAFSLAGIVAAVRFRFTLTQPSHTLYIFASITIGLGAGISAMEISAVVSMAFVYVTMLFWMFDYGADLNTRFFSFLTGRDHRDDDL
jgi:hypothetical protein